MKIQCEIDKINTLKKGMKIILAIGEKETPMVMKNIFNFMDKPIVVDFMVDNNEQLKRLNQISPEQRKKCYALFKDIANYTGNIAEFEKENMKHLFIRDRNCEPFSLSDCSRETASEFIEWMIEFCFQHGIGLSEHPREGFDDIEDYLKMCIKYSICSICGQPGGIHHWDAIGMGRDRKVYNDSGNKKICLCRTHHTEVETIGRDTFAEKYHVKGVLV